MNLSLVGSKKKERLCQVKRVVRNYRTDLIILINLMSPAVHCDNTLYGKGGFFSESAIRFFKSPKKNIPKNYPELEI